MNETCAVCGVVFPATMMFRHIPAGEGSTMRCCYGCVGAMIRCGDNVEEARNYSYWGPSVSADCVQRGPGAYRVVGS